MDNVFYYIRGEVGGPNAEVMIKIERAASPDDGFSLPVSQRPALVSAARAGLSSLMSYCASQYANAATWTLPEYSELHRAILTMSAP